MRRPTLKHPVIVSIVVLVSAGALLTGAPPEKVAVAALAMWVLLRFGVLILGGLAAPLPEPPPPGELRKVKLTYRCEICGTEVRMTTATTTEPEAPRHCMDDMTLVTPVEDL